MATCLEVITAAMQMTGVLALGKSPKAAETERGLRALQSLYDQWLTGGMFGTLEDVYLSDDDTAEEGKRYLLASGVTLTEPTTIAAEDSRDGEERQPRDLSVYESVTSTGTRAVRLYDRSEWVDLLGLDSGDVAPLSKRNSDGLAAVLATSAGFIGAFGAPANETVVALARHFLRNMVGKQGSTQDRDGADYF